MFAGVTAICEQPADTSQGILSILQRQEVTRAALPKRVCWLPSDENHPKMHRANPSGAQKRTRNPLTPSKTPAKALPKAQLQQLNPSGKPLLFQSGLPSPESSSCAKLYRG